MYEESAQTDLHNIMDKWIMSSTQSLVEFVHREMNGQ